eukprot:scaffold19235_cov126-Isochrysis_galbana.AAC.22
MGPFVAQNELEPALHALLEEGVALKDSAVHRHLALVGVLRQVKQGGDADGREEGGARRDAHARLAYQDAVSLGGGDDPSLGQHPANLAQRGRGVGLHRRHRRPHSGDRALRTTASLRVTRVSSPRYMPEIIFSSCCAPGLSEARSTAVS